MGEWAVGYAWIRAAAGAEQVAGGGDGGEVYVG